jgi:hypothetical protein
MMKSSMDVCSVHYIERKLCLEQSRLYKAIAIALTSYLVVMFVSVFVGVGQGVTPKFGDKMLNAFLSYQLAPLLLVIYSAFSLSSVYTPVFDYTNPEFKTIRFRRSWRNLLFEKNADFVSVLERSILLARAGHSYELELLLVDVSDVDRVLKVCQICDPIELTELSSDCSEDEAFTKG